MSLAAWLLAAAGTLGSLGWIYLFLGALRYRHRVVYLADLDGEEPPGGWPSLAVVMAARDEAARVEAAVRSLLRRDYPGMQVVAVNDRSVDGTGQILERLAAADGALRVVHVETLPAAWLGKTHALEMGWRATRAEWILFTDADVVFAPGALRRSVGHAARAGLDHLAVIPDVPPHSSGEALFLTMFGLMFFASAPPWRVEDPRSRRFVGTGAFQLIRRRALEDIGGMERLAFSVDEDVRLGQALKWTGHRAGCLLGNDAVSVRWQDGLAAMVAGLEKNFFGAAGYRLWRAAGFLVVLGVLGAGPHLGLVVGPWGVRVVCGAGVAAVAALLHAAGKRRRIPWYHALTLPLGAGLLAAALMRSVGATLWRGGVRWRDTDYPLGALRAHVRERDAWLRRAWRSSRRGKAAL